MALQRLPLRADVATVQTVGDAVERGNLQALSQRKLNALGLPVAYVDRSFRYRFANRAFLDWLGQRPEEVLGREMDEVLGREVWTLYHAYTEAALRGRAHRVRAPARHRRPAGHLDPRRLLPGPRIARARARLPGHLQRRRPPEAPRARGRPARAPAAPGHRQRRRADPVRRPPAEDPLRQPAVRRLDRRARPTTCSGHGLRDVLAGRLDERDERVAGARVRRRVASATSGARTKSTGELRWMRVTLFPDREISGPHRRRVRRAERHRGRRPHPRRAEGPAGAAAPLRRQHPRPDRLPRPRAALHVRQPGVRQPRVRGRRRRSTAARPRRSCRRRWPDSCGRCSSARRTARTSSTSASARCPAATSAGCTGASRPTSTRRQGARPLLHRVRHPRPQATEQALATREQQLRLFTDNIPEPVVYLDAERRYVFVNEAFLRLYGLKRDDVIGRRSDRGDRQRGHRGARAGTPARDVGRGGHLRARGHRRAGTHTLDSRALRAGPATSTEP